MNEYLIWALKLAGLAQLALVAGSVAIPKCLDWKGGLAGLMPLLRQMFWAYAIYISAILCTAMLILGLPYLFGEKFVEEVTLPSRNVLEYIN